jgi:hypothetical protein
MKTTTNMKTSMIPGISHKIILQLATVALLASAGSGTAATITLNAYSQMRYDAYNADIGVYGPPSVPNNYATLFYSPPEYNTESRTVWQFKLDDLGLTTDDVLSAKVKWGSTTPWGGGYILGIDVVNSDFTTWNNTPMYGFSANGVTFGESLAVAKWNGTSVESQNDCTNAFKNALTSATANKGLALRFYQDALPGQYAGGYFDPVTIEVTTRPSYALWASTNAGGQTADLDWDNDGVTNGVEYFMNAAPGFTANPVLDSSNKITWTNGDNIRSSEYGTRFVVQTSADLTTWEDVAENQLFSNDGSLSYIVTGSGKQFVRLKVMP